MSRILVLYYSSYGHVETMAEAVADGAREAGASVDIKRVAETVPEDIARQHHFKLDQAAPVAKPDDLVDYDAIIVGSPTRFGRMASPMAAFWEQTGGLWMKRALVGKVGAAFTSTASQHGGQETTLLSTITNLLHQGLIICGLPYAFEGQLTLEEMTGGAPYGATTIAGADGSRQVSDNEKGGARFLGKHVAQVSAKLAA